MYEQIVAKEAKIAIIGLGYVGLPIALEFAKKVSVLGFDIKEDRVEMIRQKNDPSKELPPSAFEGCDIQFTCDPEQIRDARFYVVTVPTPINEHNEPELAPLLGASHTVGKVLKEGDYVVFESTVFPGATEEECVPVLEKESGLQYIRDFKVGFSPERINPGDKQHTLVSIQKVTSGCDAESADVIARIYELIIQAGVHQASSIKVAEAAKIIENTQRDLNIAFMNELSIIFNRMGINTFEVIEAASTKWNFLKFYPGLVGGHCIGVDPYYLTYKAKELGYHAQIINAGRYVNDSMGRYLAKQVVKKLINKDKHPRAIRIQILGATFKENVSDIRNSRVVDVIDELKSYSIDKIDVMDPYASEKELKEEYGLELSHSHDGPYDAIILAVNHREYTDLPEEEFLKNAAEDALFVDVKGIYRDKIRKMDYWSL
ncbi:MAG: nucleotide sugar dehydrogenase [Bacteroidales bacterium]|nr:nucleotide sugar dehydrogenase [Bacteroidales bacterium]